MRRKILAPGVSKISRITQLTELTQLTQLTELTQLTQLTKVTGNLTERAPIVKESSRIVKNLAKASASWSPPCLSMPLMSH